MPHVWLNVKETITNCFLKIVLDYNEYIYIYIYIHMPHVWLNVKETITNCLKIVLDYNETSSSLSREEEQRS